LVVALRTASRNAPPRLVPLSAVNDEGYVIKPEFWASVEGEEVFVTAVLERTVVYKRGEERILTNRANCLVDPTILVMFPASGPGSWRGRKAVTGPVSAVKPAPAPENLAAGKAE